MARRSEPARQQVTVGRFEVEQDGHTAFLEYNLAGNTLQLLHTEVPKALQGLGLASELAHEALEWAREHGARVDVVCEFVADYLKKHPEYEDLVLH
jgi:predicted GNAT family acetyltransferase